ncbi:hypothetical protein [Flavobacterium wongokense]|uniref:hypothetical protein n=1 Tax=Flavobacterium wongokense TaxID=2910674 RepID=UPI001F3BB968|nr:hypothetical protein [Flavobacterium sp. WG47]MCF6133188.1 hypothetical protein [Flavobacterium sp. WG47]
MKTILKTTAVALFLLLTIPESTWAQGPPPWAPAHGYRAKTRHIYFPQYNMYYDMNRSSYLYLNGGHWSVSAALPSIFVGVNLGNAAQIQLNYNGYDPYRYNEVHVVEYRRYVEEPHYHYAYECNDHHHHKHGHGKKHKKHKHHDD